MRNISCDFRSNYSCWKETVSELNRKWAGMIIPVEVMMCLFMAVGLIGNTLVLVIYSFRRQKTSANIFIMFLACIDLFACIVLHPYIIYKQLHNFDQTWKETCKVFEYFNHCSLALSGMTLLLVAIDRFLAICRPVQFLLFDKHVVKAITSITIIAVVISLPIFELYGAAPYKIKEFKSNFTGFKCHYKVQYQNSAILTAFGTFIMGGFLIEIVAMVILYKHVAITAYKSRRTVRPLSNAHILAGINPSVTSDKQTSKRTQCSELSDRSLCPSPLLNAIPLQKMQRDTNNGALAASRYSSERNVPTTSNSEDIVNAQGDPIAPPEDNLKAQGDPIAPTEVRKDISGIQKLSPRLKAAKILFSVTAVFFLSWMPFFIMRICENLDPHYWSDQSETRFIIEHLLNHVFYLNNAANPIIYTIINKNFRIDCKKVIGKHCRFSRP